MLRMLSALCLLTGCSLGLPVIELDLEQEAERFVETEIEKDQAEKVPVKESGK